MVSIGAAGLTKVGFRRDIRFFLASLVGFLIIIILVLVTLLQNFVGRMVEAEQENWNRVAETVAAALDASSGSDADAQSRIVELRGRYGLAGLMLERPRGARISSGFPHGVDIARVSRRTRHGTVTLSFDASRLAFVRRTFLLTAAICVSATLLGTILLMLYLPRITRPIEEMLDQAKELGDRASDVDESSYLIETFRTSIETLRRQESELKQLHELEKTRADDLARITVTLTRSLSSGFIATGPDGRVLDVNAAGREILGLPADATPGGSPIHDAFGRTPFAEVLARATAERSSLSRFEIAATGNPDALVIGLTTVPLYNERDEFLGMLALFTDLTPIRSLESRVRDLQTLADLGEISAGIAHEFRNSLSTILGYLKLVRRSSLPPEADSRLRIAEEEAALLSAAVERLLAFARPMRLERQPVDLKELLDEITERLEHRGSDIDVSIEGQPVAIEGDRALLARAFENLVRNAVDAVEQKGGGFVRISTTSTPAPRVAIEDSGVGLDPSDAPRLFLPFQSDKANGFGLGLPLAKKIILLHGGTIRLTGEPGRGASAIVEFPAESATRGDAAA